MAFKFESFSENPEGNNANPPPIGAPENQTALKDLNNILRYVMASIAELGNHAISKFNSYGSMALQNSTSVSITGGSINPATDNGFTISNKASIDAGAIKSGTLQEARVPNAQNASKIANLTLQQLYDFIYPIGSSIIMFNNVGSIPVPSGVTATWSRISGGRYLRLFGSDLGTFPVTGGDNLVATSSSGSHNHGGKTADHTLTISQIPAHTHPVPSGGPSSGIIGYRTEANSQNSGSQTTGSTGGGAPHSHNISSDGAHTHSVTVEPLYIGCSIWRRTA